MTELLFSHHASKPKVSVATAVKTWLFNKKMNLHFFQTLSRTSSNVGEIISKFRKGRKVCLRLFTSTIKPEIRHFYIMVVQ